VSQVISFVHQIDLGSSGKPTIKYAEFLDGAFASSDGRPSLGTEFRWKSFGVTIDSTVLESVRHERVAWDAHCDGVHVIPLP
jgi:hypothetical protein